MGDHLAPGSGGEGVAADAPHQADAEALLQLANLNAHGRLAEIQPPRRRGKVALLHDLDEGAKLIKIEVAHLPVPRDR
jgi:hypothetical protein